MHGKKKSAECLQQIIVKDIHPVASKKAWDPFKRLEFSEAAQHADHAQLWERKKIWGFPVSKTLTNFHAIGTYTYDHQAKWPFEEKKKKKDSIDLRH
jgi:hypothetical protein